MSLATSIDVLLATYEGARFLPQQIESLEMQTETSFRILARDDGSSDGTLGLLASLAERRPGRVTLLPSQGRRLGSRANFGELLQSSAAPYVMFCDQDDRWDANKIAVSLAEMHRLEQKFDPTTPILVHTDLRVVDENLGLLSSSLWRYSNVDPHRGATLRRLLGQNVVTGSASLLNRPLVDLALPIPDQAIMHDWWIALVAAAFGVVQAIPQATSDYRQHGANDVGAKRWDLDYIARKTFELGDRTALLDNLRRTANQARAFAERFRSRLSRSELELIESYASLPEQGFLERRKTILERGFWKHGWIRSVGFLCRV